VKVFVVLLAALTLPGCASPDFGLHDAAPGAVARPGAREALEQQLDSPNCRAKAQRETITLADAAGVPATTVAFEATKQYAQLDDPTRDWTREQATGSPAQCPPTGRKHRYFA
jgi:hypothetical protein